MLRTVSTCDIFNNIVFYLGLKLSPYSAHPVLRPAVKG